MYKYSILAKFIKSAKKLASSTDEVCIFRHDGNMKININLPEGVPQVTSELTLESNS